MSDPTAPQAFMDRWQTAGAPEQRARQQIDAQLAASGWVVQDCKQFDPSAGRGIALREAPLKSGFSSGLTCVRVIFINIFTFLVYPDHRSDVSHCFTVSC